MKKRLKDYGIFALGAIAIGLALALELMIIGLGLAEDAVSSVSEWCQQKLEHEETEHGSN